MIFDTLLPRVQSFLRPARLKKKSRGLLIRLLTAFVFHVGAMTASAAAQAHRSDPRHTAAIGRFLGRQRWAAGEWLERLRLRLRRSDRSKGVFLFILDQTNCSKQGEKTENTFSCGNSKRRPKKGRRYQTKKYTRKRCHGFVAGLLITPGGVRLPYRLSYCTKEYCEKTGRKYRTQAQLGAALIDPLRLPEGAEVVVLGDTAYDAACVRKATERRGWEWIVPLNPERVLAGEKPRPKVRTLLESLSAKGFSPSEVRADRDPYRQQRRGSWDGRGRKIPQRVYYVQASQQQVHSVGEVVLLFSTTRQPHAGQPLHEPKILMSNALKRSASDLVHLYTIRWQIELFFKEMKSQLGMHQYRFRDFVRVERWVDSALAAFVYLEWYRWKRMRRKDLTEEERDWWRRQRTGGLRQTVRQAVEQDELRRLDRALQTEGGCRRLRRLLRDLLSPKQPTQGRKSA